MFGFIKRIFGSAQVRKVHSYKKLVKEINRIDAELDGFGEEIIIKKHDELVKLISQGISRDEIITQAYAVVKNACKRLCGKTITVMGHDIKWEMVPFDVQLIGAIAMHYGNIAEMQTGEGKTLTATMPAYLNALSGSQVHIVTVNDYLAQRDCEWNRHLFNMLGLSVGFINSNMQHEEKKDQYNKDIIYGTASEFGFDYLRDNSIASRKEHQVQRGHLFAIIDEIDFVLIDDARTPLRISGPSNQSSEIYSELKDITDSLVAKQKDLCNKIANKAWKSLDEVGATSKKLDSFSENSKDKEKEKIIKEAIKDLWCVSKGMPKNKILRKAKELPFIRTLIDKQDLQAYGENAQKEKADVLSKLYIIVDEKGNEFELSDNGIKKWKDLERRHGSQDGIFNFELTDIDSECEKIDCNQMLCESEKNEKKLLIHSKESKRKEKAHAINQLLRSHLLMERDVDYIVADGKIVIIDENTGRAQPGRRYSEGLHQAIEAKENVNIQKESVTYATITLQNYFKKYAKLSGMSGTAITDAQEFKHIYKLDVLCIPTKKPCIRIEFEDEIYMTEREKFAAILAEINCIHAKGRPILIGTRSVDESERLSKMLSTYKLPHNVLNAKNHAMEADIISEAGQFGAITISTNMAGRGTDIKLGKGVSELGGLHVIGSRHFCRRNDRQLIGRCARQGDPGSSKFFGSFEDDLMRIFASPSILKVLGKFRPPEGESISARMLTKSIENAQQRIENRNFSSRKHTLEYDNVISQQRDEIYSFRQYIMDNESLDDLSKDSMYHLSIYAAKKLWSKNKREIKDLENWMLYDCGMKNAEGKECKDEQEMQEFLYYCLFKEITNKISTVSEHCLGSDSLEALKETIKWIIIKRLDTCWQSHIRMIDQLKTELPLRTVGQKDPLIEFKNESFTMFKNMVETIHYLCGIDIIRLELIVPGDKNI